MFDRLPAAPTLILLLSLSLAACEGPTGPTGPEGPEGEAGPGTRIVLSGTMSLSSEPDSVFVLWDQALPPEAGTAADPPSITCWLSEDNELWFQDSCAFIASDDQTFLIVLLIGPNGSSYRIVVVY